ncbi:hypothetical protein COY07_06400 [Candidatus Peregrinibacteria bacterium CG_4_10_14_0_2_um_filter_43_11]|nr:MAG: hypothetical protein COY07_06400 [Candidatus Peregrinibacteria bacterium CG_4_10_14_0_2_um_filter_43_11]
MPINNYCVTLTPQPESGDFREDVGRSLLAPGCHKDVSGVFRLVAPLDQIQRPETGVIESRRVWAQWVVAVRSAVLAWCRQSDEIAIPPELTNFLAD